MAEPDEPRPGTATILAALIAVLDALAAFEEARGAAQEERLLARWRHYRAVAGQRDDDVPPS